MHFADPYISLSIPINFQVAAKRSYLMIEEMNDADHAGVMHSTYNGLVSESVLPKFSVLKKWHRSSYL